MKTTVVPSVSNEREDLFSYVLDTVNKYSNTVSHEVEFIEFSARRETSKLRRFISLVNDIRKSNGPYYCHSLNWLPVLIRLIKILSNVKIVFWLCNDGREQIRSMPVRQRIQEYILTKLSLMSSTIIVTCSPWVKKEIIEYYGISSKSDVRIIPNFIYSEDISSNLLKHEDEQKVVSFVSSFQPRKGFDEFLKLTNLKFESDTKIKFEIRGYGDAESRRRAFAIDAEHAKLPNSKLKLYLETIHFLVVPARHQGFGRIYLEGMAKDCITVLPDIDSVRAWITHFTSLDKSEIDQLAWAPPDHISIGYLIQNFLNGEKSLLDTLMIQRRLITQFQAEEIQPLWFDIFNEL